MARFQRVERRRDRLGVGRDQMRRRACRAPWPGCRPRSARRCRRCTPAARCTRVPAAGMKPELTARSMPCGAASRSSSTQSMPASRSISAAVRPQAPAPTMATGTSGVPAGIAAARIDAGRVRHQAVGRCRYWPRGLPITPAVLVDLHRRAGRWRRRAPTAPAPRTACSPGSTASPWRAIVQVRAGSTSAMSASKPAAMSPLLFRPKRCAGVPARHARPCGCSPCRACVPSLTSAGSRYSVPPKPLLAIQMLPK